MGDYMVLLSQGLYLSAGEHQGLPSVLAETKHG